jgi:hypothetical protein
MAPLWSSACSSAKALGQGQPCFQAVECAEGLACVPKNPMMPDAGSLCSNDLTGVVNVTADSGPAMEGGMMMEGGPMDTGVVMDTGVMMDTGVGD